MVAVTPAKEPASKRLPGGKVLQGKRSKEPHQAVEDVMDDSSKSLHAGSKTIRLEDDVNQNSMLTSTL